MPSEIPTRSADDMPTDGSEWSNFPYLSQPNYKLCVASGSLYSATILVHSLLNRLELATLSSFLVHIEVMCECHGSPVFTDSDIL
jgi:hypothetical protein